MGDLITQEVQDSAMHSEKKASPLKLIPEFLPD